MADEPMSDERLAEIRNHAETVRSWIKWPAAPAVIDVRNPDPEPPQEVPMVAIRLGSDVLSLLAAYDRLRAREAAALAIVREVASVPDADYIEECPFCHQMPDYIPIKHTPDCPVTKARALLAEESEAH